MRSYSKTGDPGGAEDRYFAAIGGHVADILNEVGVPYCKGGVMGKNEAWRGSVATWQARVTGWMTRSRATDLLAIDIFYDMRGVHGELGLADTLWRFAYDAAKATPSLRNCWSKRPAGLSGASTFSDA